ncbi:MAG: hypothetical protein HYT49_03700 [Candidatus Wildermuthbacteria bacterium]|nr:hypothetical protein [Candidatus Wildermuthbacteria bacterium]
MAQSDVFEARKIVLNFTPIETQKEIVEKLNAAQEYKKGLLEQKAKLQELFDGVLYRSMTGEFDQ